MAENRSGKSTFAAAWGVFELPPHLKRLVAWIQRVFTFPETSVATLNLCLRPKHAFDGWREEKLICWFWEAAEPVQFSANIRTPEPGEALRSQADRAHSQIKTRRAVLNGNIILSKKKKKKESKESKPIN